MLKLFYSPGACSRAAHIALHEAGVPHEAIRVDFKSGEQTKPEYMAINPKGRVPALVTDAGILTETPAILAYIAQSHPAAKLAPLDDPFAFAKAQAFNNYLCATVHVAHAHGGRGNRWSDDAGAIETMKAKVPQVMGACFDLIEREMFKGPFVLGDSYSICDPYLFTIEGWLAGDSVDIARFPKIHAHNKAMSERPAVKKALAVEAG